MSSTNTTFWSVASWFAIVYIHCCCGCLFGDTQCMHGSWYNVNTRPHSFGRKQRSARYPFRCCLLWCRVCVWMCCAPDDRRCCGMTATANTAMYNARITHAARLPPPPMSVRPLLLTRNNNTKPELASEWVLERRLHVLCWTNMYVICYES